MSNELKAAVSTAFFTFLGLFGMAVLGFIQQVIDWANAGGVTVFPDVSVLGKAAVSAGLAAAVGLVNFAWRWLQSKGVPLPGARPTYLPPGA